jgi:arginine-tRNA-protein transferase
MSGKSSGSPYEAIRRGSVVRDLGVRPIHCAYCSASAPDSVTGISHFLLSNNLSVDDYQDLLDRGWKRASGRVIELPVLQQTCCQIYTIRLRADAFVPSKDQINIDRRMQRFLEGTYIHKTKPRTNITITSSDSISTEDFQGQNYSNFTIIFLSIFAKGLYRL